jgi:hypothetical protein
MSVRQWLFFYAVKMKGIWSVLDIFPVPVGVLGFSGVLILNFNTFLQTNSGRLI